MAETAGIGVVLLLHEIYPDHNKAFDPNRTLKVSPDLLEKLIICIRQFDLEIVSLDEAHRRMSQRAFGKRFASFAFDAGYRDNHEHAYGILRKHEASFAVASDFADGQAQLWWFALAKVIDSVHHLCLSMNGQRRHPRCYHPRDRHALEYLDCRYPLRVKPSVHEVTGPFAPRVAPGSDCRSRSERDLAHR
jgi:peptidoglycan/xylan/chitin deacetylase (PgdA/CDA1 family)